LLDKHNMKVDIIDEPLYMRHIYHKMLQSIAIRNNQGKGARIFNREWLHFHYEQLIKIRRPAKWWRNRCNRLQFDSSLAFFEKAVAKIGRLTINQSQRCYFARLSGFTG
jgi:hypothetical protein